jgi:hypothetical protein
MGFSLSRPCGTRLSLADPETIRRIRNWLAMAHGAAVRVTEASTSDATDAEVHGSYEEP